MQNIVWLFPLRYGGGHFIRGSLQKKREWIFACGRLTNVCHLLFSNDCYQKRNCYIFSSLFSVSPDESAGLARNAAIWRHSYAKRWRTPDGVFPDHQLVHNSVVTFDFCFDRSAVVKRAANTHHDTLVEFNSQSEKKHNKKPAVIADEITRFHFENCYKPTCNRLKRP